MNRPENPQSSPLLERAALHTLLMEVRLMQEKRILNIKNKEKNQEISSSLKINLDTRTVLYLLYTLIFKLTPEDKYLSEKDCNILQSMRLKEKNLIFTVDNTEKQVPMRKIFYVFYKYMGDEGAKESYFTLIRRKYDKNTTSQEKEKAEKVENIVLELMGLYWKREATKNTFTITVEKNIESVYNEKSVYSCLFHKEETAWFDLPAIRPVVSVVCLRDQSQTLKARALLWEAVNEQGKACQVLDRIYPPEAEYTPHIARMLDWAQGQGIDTRVGQGTSGYWKSHQQYFVEVEESSLIQENTPFLDSFQYGITQPAKENQPATVRLYSNPSPAQQHAAQYLLYDVHGKTIIRNHHCLHCGQAMSSDDIERTLNDSNKPIIVCYNCLEQQYAKIELCSEDYKWLLGQYIQRKQTRIYTPEKEFEYIVHIKDPLKGAIFTLENF